MLSLDELEQIEQLAMEMVVQALTDYCEQIVTIFHEETDMPQDIAEDVTREAMEKMGLPGISERLYGKVDFKKAIYTFLPAAQPVALMLDAKAEKLNGNRTATIQMSQTSMIVKMNRSGVIVEQPGRLEQVIERNDKKLHVVTVIAKYVYESLEQAHQLHKIIVACIPNGLLQARYNPFADETIWLAGRDAPTRGEDFRVRLDYAKLRQKAPWRVRELWPRKKGTS